MTELTKEQKINEIMEALLSEVSGTANPAKNLAFRMAVMQYDFSELLIKFKNGARHE